MTNSHFKKYCYYMAVHIHKIKENPERPYSSEIQILTQLHSMTNPHSLVHSTRVKGPMTLTRK